MTKHLWWLMATLSACGVGPSSTVELGVLPVTRLPGVPVVDLRADGNRDGTTRLDDDADDADEDSWNAQHGAVFLANLDDDMGACPKRATLTDAQLASCNDAADEVFNGPEDLEDMAMLRTQPWPDAPEGTTARLVAAAPGSSYVRLFHRVGNVVEVLPSTGALSAAEVRDGATLWLEGKDLVRNTAQWDGFVDVTLQVTVPNQQQWQSGLFRDTVRLRVAPVLTFHHLTPVETAYASNIRGDPDSALFRNDLGRAFQSASQPITFVTPQVDDQWTQDFFETGYATMPGLNGTPRVMRVMFRSANVYQPDDAAFPLREAGRLVFTLFRGHDVAGVQQFDLRSPEETQSLNSFGNFETIPPYTLGSKSWPLGRVLRGAVSSFHPDATFMKMTDGQAYQGPAVEIDTSWLLVGHVDETLSFLPVNSPRGWVLLVNDARLAKTMLEAEVQRGNGSVAVFANQWWLDDNFNETPAQTTIQAILNDTDVMQASNAAAIKVDAQLAILKRETGLTDEEIIHVPFLHQDVMGSSLAYQPGTVNMMVIDAHTVAVADPHGPIIDGADLFKTQLQNALAPLNVTVHWVENWNLYHRAAGEVHCGTNATRVIPSKQWWEVTP